MKRRMKKFLSLFMAMAMIFMALPTGIIAHAATPNAKVAALSDLNVKQNGIDTQGLLLSKSEALLDEAVQKLLASDAQVVLVTGDLTWDGSKASHTLVVSKLKKLLDAGKKVYVIPGERDVKESGVNAAAVTKQEFAAIYEDYGYAGTIRDDSTLSYVAEPVAGFQLLMLDTVADASALSKEHYGKGAVNSDWALQQIKSAKSAGKTIVAGSHHPGISRGSVEGTVASVMGMIGDLKDADGNPLYTGDPLEGLTLVDKSAFSYTDLLAMADAGLTYLFSGHTQMIDISSAETEKGNTVYDVGSGSLTAASSSIRYADFADKKVSFTTSMITTVGGQSVQTLARQAVEAYVPTYVNEAVAIALPAVHRALAIFEPIAQTFAANLDLSSIDLPDAIKGAAINGIRAGIKNLITDVFAVLKNSDNLNPAITEIKDGILATKVDGVPMSKILADVMITKQLGDEQVPATLQKLMNDLQTGNSKALADIIASFADEFKAEKTVSLLNKVLDCNFVIKVVAFSDSKTVRELLAGTVTFSLAGQSVPFSVWDTIEGMSPGLTAMAKPYVNALLLGADDAATPKQTPARFKANLKAMAPDIAEMLAPLGLGDLLANALKDTGPADNTLTVYSYTVSDVEEMIKALDPANLKASQYPAVLSVIESYNSLSTAEADSLSASSKEAYQAILEKKDALKLAYDAYKAIMAVGAVTYERYDTVKEELAAAKAAIDKAVMSYIDNYDSYTQKAEQFNALTKVKENVEKVTSLIDGLGTITLESKEKLEAAEAAYNALGDAAQYVANAQVLKDARTEYDALVADETAVQDAIAKINAIGEVTLSPESLAKIEAAEAAYNALGAAQKERVTNHQVLKDAREKYNSLVGVQKDATIVINKIDAIGEVTLESDFAIRKAEAAYARLNDEQKAMVHNHSVMVAARAAYDQLVRDAAAVQDVENKIYVLGKAEITDEFLSRLGTAEQAYSKLGADLQAEVKNYSTLTAARTAYDKLLAEKQQLDPVVEKIDAIPDPVTLDSLVALAQAEDAYNALTEKLQLKVTNYNKLKAARTAYDKLIKEADAVATAKVQIDAIGTVEHTDESFQKLIDAELAYAAVPESQKDKVDNAQTLLDARTAFDALRLAAVTPSGESGAGISYVNIRITPSQNFVFSLTEPGQDEKVINFDVTLKAKKNSSINYGWMVNEKLSDADRLLPIGKDYSLGWNDSMDRDINGGLGTGDSNWTGHIQFTATEAAEYTSGVGIAVDVGATSWGKSVKYATLTLKVTVLDKRELVTVLNQAKAMDTGKLSESDAAVLAKAMQLAEEILKDDGASKQGQVDAALLALKSAMVQSADYSELDAAIRSGKMVDGTLFADITELQSALADGTALARDLKISDQQKVDDAAKAIRDALAKLVYKKADYTQADALLVEAGKLSPELYEDFSAVGAAMDDLNKNRGLDITQQANVDQLVHNLRVAIQNLRLKAGNYTELDEILDRLAKIDPSWIKDDTAVREKLFDVVPGLDVTHQEYINEVARNLQEAEKTIVYNDANYQKVDEAIEAANKLNKNLYKNWSIVQKELDNVVRGKDIRAQGEVDAMADAINSAIDRLEYLDADYSKVDEAIARAQALIKDNYVDFSAVTAAVNAVVRDKNVTEQAAVDAMAEAINAAIGALELKAADYSKVDEAIALANEKKASGLYQDFTAVDAAIANVDRTMKITEQSDVDAMAKAINDAINGLKYKPADYSAVDAALAAADKIEKDWVEDYSAVEQAVNAVVRGKNITEQSEVDAMADAINKAIAGLVYLPADYSGVEDAVKEANGLDASLYENYDEVLAAIQAVEDGFNKSQQGDVNAMEEAIRLALKNLKYKAADYEKLNALVEEAKAYDSSLYKDFSAVEAALNAIDMDKNITQQDDVDAMEEALRAALSGLEYKSADYSQLNELIERAKALNPSMFKDFSAVEAALNAIDMGKNITQQEEVDAMAKALGDALDGLELKPDGNGGDSGNLPQTGDAALSAMTALAGAAAGLYLLSRKKKEQDSED